jgi:hypothetical protein
MDWIRNEKHKTSKIKRIVTKILLILVFLENVPSHHLEDNTYNMCNLS